MTKFDTASALVSIVTVSKVRREQSRAQGTRYEFDYGAFLDGLYPDIDKATRAEILGDIYKLLK